MAEYGFSLADVLDSLTIEQAKLLLRKREQRIADERRWQMLIASVPVQKEPGEFFESLMGALEDVSKGLTPEERASEPRGTWQPPSDAPLLHEITPQQARMMRMPVKYVKVDEDK